METAAPSTTSTSKYVKDFESLFVPINKHLLRDKAREGSLRHCQFRSICWRYFLHCLPEEYDQWLDSCEQGRRNYEKIRSRHQRSKSSSPKVDSSRQSSKDEDISTDSISPSRRSNKEGELDDELHFTKIENNCDHSDLSRTIERDVVRTFPDMEFFRRTEMQNILENVLFNYASENTHISYKQGMHELLATLLYVLHTDSQNCLINYEGGYANESIATLLNLKYLEHDAFRVFCALMKSIETWYQNDEILMIPDSFDKRGERSSSRSMGQQVSSVLSIKLKMISEAIVKSYDLELFNHLEALQIAPQIYGIRWMRLLFGREFEFLDLLTVWDAIICDQVSMSLTDYIFASMLITIREELVNGDYTDCLNNLMRYQFKDVQYVIKLALHLRDPDNNNRPQSLRTNLHRGSSQSKHKRYTPETSLTDKLSRQYIKDKYPQNSNQLRHISNTSYQPHSKSTNQILQNKSEYKHRSLAQQNSPSTSDNRDSRKIFSMTSASSNQQFHDRQHMDRLYSSTLGRVSSSKSDRALTNSSRAVSTSSNKFLPNINRLVSTIGQNIQDMAAQPISQQSPNLRASQRSSGSVAASPPSHRGDQLPFKTSLVKEYEMREIPATSSSAARGNQANRFPIGSIGGVTAALNLSTESYDDLHSIVDYCWRLLSEQIDSLQRCLPKEKGLHSEDEIFVALAQLKKVRDVLKGSLKLEDELESTTQG